MSFCWQRAKNGGLLNLDSWECWEQQEPHIQNKMSWYMAQHRNSVCRVLQDGSLNTPTKNCIVAEDFIATEGVSILDVGKHNVMGPMFNRYGRVKVGLLLTVPLDQLHHCRFSIIVSRMTYGLLSRLSRTQVLSDIKWPRWLFFWFLSMIALITQLSSLPGRDQANIHIAPSGDVAQDGQCTFEDPLAGSSLVGTDGTDGPESSTRPKF